LGRYSIFAEKGVKEGVTGKEIGLKKEKDKPSGVGTN